ncbi:MAG TPA: hypothetical protein VJM50_09645 [Pyrinomonadaceae bacterium]|nr:hypothetical protein [Pyrinomonadaceae bacterium]
MSSPLAGCCAKFQLLRGRAERGISDYSAIGALIDSGIPPQVEFDMQALQRAAGRKLSEPEQEQFRAIQRQALRCGRPAKVADA